MKKKKMMGAAFLSLCLAMGMSTGTMADSRKVVTLGADLTEQQKQIVMNYFGVTADEVDILTINNQDERDHLGAFVPLEQIGTRTYSCALVSPTRSGGIQVKTANLDWVTCNMIATTLSTSGVVNCDVIAASPIKVSGTGALTGIIMAYEQASGEELDPQKKELATQELVITGQLADTVGQKEATAIVNEAKTEIISQNITDITVIQNVINEAASQNNAQLSDEEKDMLLELLDKISQEDYVFAEMQDTLERVEENVGNIEDELTQQKLEEQERERQEEEEAAAQAAAEAAQHEAEPQETEPSILDNTNDDAFGEDVIMGSTLEPETEAPESENIFDETEEFMWPEETANFAEETEGSIEEPEENLMETPETGLWDPEETEGLTEAPVETEELTDIPEPLYTVNDLNQEKSIVYKEINWYLDKVLGLPSVYSESQEYKEINEMTVTRLETSEETNKKLKEQFDTFLLELLVKGPESRDMNEIDEAEFGLPEVKLMYDELNRLLVIDEAQTFMNVDLEVRKKICDEANGFFKKIYGLEDELEEDSEGFEENGFSDENNGLEDSESMDTDIPEASEDGTVE